MNEGTGTSLPHDGQELAHRRAAGHGKASAKPKRASRGLVRFWAWTVGALSFLSPFALFGVSPRPAQGAPATPSQTAASTRRRPVVVVVTKRIVYTKSASSSVSPSGGAPVQYVQAPAAAPVAVSCSTPPC